MRKAEEIDCVPRTYFLMTTLAAALTILIVWSAGLGYVQVAYTDVMRIVAARLFDAPQWVSTVDDLAATVVMDVRLPRILTSAAVGGALALAGTVFQGILRNPLADPYTLGVSAGAAFGAAVALLLNITALGLVSVPLFAFAGAAATLGSVIFLSASAGGLSSNNLILSGVIVAAILSAGLSFLKYLADEQVSVIVFWLMGSFASKTWPEVGLTTAVGTIGLLTALFFARDLNLMALGDRSAASLGVETRQVTLVLLAVASLVAAVCVSVSGIIGFVGLLVPHMMRAVTGPDNRRLLPVAVLAGAVLLLGADTVTRALLPSEVPIGILTALIGGPFFCWIFRRRQMAVPG